MTADDPAAFASLEFLFSNILGLVVTFAGLAVFVMFIVGGYKYLLSGGDPKKAGEGAATLTWAVGGLVVLLLVWFVLVFIKNFTGVDVTVFKVPGI